MDARDAYRMGYNNSRNTRTGDLDAAEDRFTRKHGAALVDAFNAGWSDYSCGNGYGYELPNYI